MDNGKLVLRARRFADFGMVDLSIAALGETRKAGCRFSPMPLCTQLLESVPMEHNETYTLSTFGKPHAWQRSHSWGGRP